MVFGGYVACACVGVFGLFLMLHGTGHHVPRRRKKIFK